MNTRSTENGYSCADMNLACTLYALGAQLLKIDRNNPGRFAFVFEDTDDLQRAVEAFWRRELSIEPQLVLSSLRAIKARMYSER